MLGFTTIEIVMLTATFVCLVLIMGSVVAESVKARKIALRIQSGLRNDEAQRLIWYKEAMRQQGIDPDRVDESVIVAEMRYAWGENPNDLRIAKEEEDFSDLPKRMEDIVQRYKDKIAKLETELATESSYIVCWRQTCEQLEAQLDAVKDILYGSKHADIDKLEQIEAAIGEDHG